MTTIVPFEGTLDPAPTVVPFNGDLDAPSDKIQGLISAITGVESGGNADATSPQGARGSMQIMPATFKQYAKPGESYDNDADRRAAATRKIIDDYAFYGGDIGKTAAAYIGGRGAVRDDGSIRDDVADALGTTPAKYAQMVTGRLGKTVPAGSGAGRGYINPTTEDSKAAAEPMPKPLPEQGFWDKVGDGMNAVRDWATGASDAPGEVGSLESLGRGWGRSGASTAKAMSLAVVAPVVVLENIKNAITGSSDTSAQDALFRNLVDPNTAAVEWYSLKPDEKQGFMAKVAEGIGAMIQDLPAMIASGGLSGETQLIKAAPTVGEHLTQVISKGFDAMRPVMVKSGVEKAQQVLDNGGTVQQAVNSGATAALHTGFMGAAPMSSAGPVVERLITGLPVGVLTGEIGRQVQNAADPENMQTPFSLEGAAVNAVTNSVMAGAMGHSDVSPVRARAKAMPDPVKDVMSAPDIDAAIAAAVKVSSAPATKGTIADQLLAIRPLVRKEVGETTNGATDAVLRSATDGSGDVRPAVPESVGTGDIADVRPGTDTGGRTVGDVGQPGEHAKEPSAGALDVQDEAARAIAKAKETAASETGTPAGVDASEGAAARPDAGERALETDGLKLRLPTGDRMKAEDIAKLSGEDVSTLHEETVAHNDAIDVEAVKQLRGEEFAREFAGWNRRKRDGWLDKNLTLEQQDALQAAYRNETDIKEYVGAHGNFDESSPSALGQSIMARVKDMGKPGWEHTPDGVTVREALNYAKEKGWDESEVLNGIRSRIDKLYGDDAKEIFPRFYAPKKQDAKQVDQRLVPVSNRKLTPADAGVSVFGDRESLTPEQHRQIEDANARQFEELYQQDVKDGIRQRLGLAPKSEASRQPLSPFRSFLREYGIQPSLAADITGARGLKANNVLPATFRKNGLNLDELASRAVERGFLSNEDVSSSVDNGGTNKLVEMIKAEIRGDRQHSSDAATEDAAAQHERVQRLEIEREANRLGLPYEADIDTDRLASMVKRIHNRLDAAGSPPVGSLKADRVLRAAQEAVARIERKRAQYEQQDVDFANANRRAQDAELDIAFDADGNPEIVKKQDLAAVLDWFDSHPNWSNEHGTDAEPKDDTRQAGAPEPSRAQAGASAADQEGASAQHGRDEVPGKQGRSEEGLTSPTREEVIAAQDRAKQAQEEDARNQRELAAKAKADAERDEFTLTGSDRPADVAAAGGQRDIFGESSNTHEHGPDKSLESRHAELDPKIDALNDEQAVKVGKELGISYKRGEDIRAKIKQAHPDDQERALDAALRPELPKELQGPRERIEDFGEKIAGARKDYAEKLKDAQSVDVAAEPLSKSWPEPDYDKLIKSGTSPWAAAFVHAARDQVPTKPKQPWKLKQYVAQVKMLREMATSILSGQTDQEIVKSRLESPEFKKLNAGLSGPIDLYMRLGHDKSLKGIAVESGSYSVYDGVHYDPAKTIWRVGPADRVFSKDNVIGNTRQEAIDAFIARETAKRATPSDTKGIEFVIWAKGGKYHIGKKIGRDYVELAKPFDTIADARQYRSDNQAALEEKLERYKSAPFERNSENQPRIGEDHRNGASVTPEAFSDAFGFRGVQFGNYVEGTRRQLDLNNAYDGLHDLAAAIGVPTKALSLDGQLGLAFGARGKGGKNPAAAHYEPDQVVINLTKANGAGSLAHEWFHALDNYFGKQGGGRGGFITDGGNTTNIRPEMAQAFKNLMLTIRASGMLSRSKELDKRRNNPYWSTNEEMAARAFESYIISKLHDQNASNDYLANIVGEDYWKAEDALFGHEGEETYPYPTKGEMEKIASAFDHFFSTIKTKETDKGVALYAREFDPEAFRRMFGENRGSLPVEEVQKTIDTLSSKHTDGPEVRVVDTPADLPVRAPADARGLIHNDTVYIVASNHRTADGVARTYGHEVIGHYGLWKMLGEDGQRQFEKNLQLALNGGNKELGELSRRVRSMYVDGDGKFNLTPGQESNEIAAFAVEKAIDPVTGEFRPGYAFMKSTFAKVAQFLRDIGIKVKFTNLELQGMLINSMKGLEVGHRLDGGGRSLVAAAVGGHDIPDVSDPRTGVSTAILELGKNDDLYQYPKSSAKTPEEIARDKGMTAVRTRDSQRENLDFTNGIEVNDGDPMGAEGRSNLNRIMAERSEAKGFKSWLIKTDKGAEGSMTQDGNKVWINVAGTGEGHGGSAIYDLASNYASNNKLEFMGDPDGLTDAGMRRRLENMLSAAVKYQSTDFLVPHKKQLLGSKSLGIPRLRWTKGDTLSNIRSMVDASIASTEHTNPIAVESIHYDPATQSFRDGADNLLDAEGLRGMLGFDDRVPGVGQGGFATLQRNALFRSLLQSEGARRVFLEQLYRQQDRGSSNPSGELKNSFYARGDTADGLTDQEVRESHYVGPGARFLQAAKDSWANIRNDILMTVAPMSAGSDAAKAAAKDFANSERLARWQWTKFDDILKNNFTEAQRKAMWEAADEENVIRQREAADPEFHREPGTGIDRLSKEERETVETLHAYGEQLLQRAKDVGMFKGEGLPYWTPRMAVMIGGDGEYLTPGGEGKQATSDGTGRNVTTTASSLRERKYLTAEETEAAMKGKLGENAMLVRDIRTMPMAMSRLERAIAGRELVNQIKDLGRQLGTETTSTSAGPQFFTLDHPAFTTFRPRMVEEDGRMTPALDQNGDMTFDKTPLYISKDFEGPLKAIMSEQSGALYKGMMALKGKAMGLIMYSPLIHNAVEWGRALPIMPGKVLTFKIYFDGNKVKNDPTQMAQAIKDGLVPIGHRGQIQDITGLMEDPSLAPGRSWTAKLLGGAVGAVNEKAGTAVKKGVDAAGDFWHNTLLWDRVGDLQAGLYAAVKSDLVKKGTDEQTAGRLAAHFANRYAGALPNEAMSAGARKIANFVLFSRSFTLGNIGVMKDMVNGFPPDIAAQIKRDAGELELRAGKSIARRKAIAAFGLDIALLYVGNSLLQSAFDKMKRDKSMDEILQGYADRFSELIKRTKEDPTELLHPFDVLSSLTPNSENEPGKEDRIHYGTEDNGTNVYMRLPTGKIGEEFKSWMTSPLETLLHKQGTFMRPITQTIENDKGFGQRVYDPDAKGWSGMAKNMGRVVWNFMSQQVPADSIQAGVDWAHGHADDTDKMKVLGPLAGLTFSKGAPGGPAVGEMYHEAKIHQGQVADIMPDVRHAIKVGDTDKAIELMESVNLTPSEIRRIIKSQEDPETRLNANSLKRYNRHASEESKARMERLR